MSVCWYICCGKDRSGELIQAVQQGDIAQTRALMVAGVYVNDSTLPFKRTALLEAAENGHVDIVKMLVEEYDALTDKDDVAGLTPLHEAAKKGHVEVVKILLKAGATIDAKNKSGQTPLHFASAQGHTAVVKLLLDSGADFTVIWEAHNMTALQIAQYRGQTEVVALLEEAEFAGR